jgi:hypothetical protein
MPANGADAQFRKETTDREAKTGRGGLYALAAFELWSWRLSLPEAQFGSHSPQVFRDIQKCLVLYLGEALRNFLSGLILAQAIEDQAGRQAALGAAIHGLIDQVNDRAFRSVILEHGDRQVYVRANGHVR